MSKFLTRNPASFLGPIMGFSRALNFSNTALRLTFPHWHSSCQALRDRDSAATAAEMNGEGGGGAGQALPCHSMME